MKTLECIVPAQALRYTRVGLKCVNLVIDFQPRSLEWVRIEVQNCFEQESTAGNEEEIVQMLYPKRTGSSSKIRSQVLRNDA